VSIPAARTSCGSRSRTKCRSGTRTDAAPDLPPIWRARSTWGSRDARRVAQPAGRGERVSGHPADPGSCRFSGPIRLCPRKPGSRARRRHRRLEAGGRAARRSPNEVGVVAQRRRPGERAVPGRGAGGAWCPSVARRGAATLWAERGSVVSGAAAAWPRRKSTADLVDADARANIAAVGGEARLAWRGLARRGVERPPAGQPGPLRPRSWPVRPWRLRAIARRSR
jgi:hypothetical protein